MVDRFVPTKSITYHKAKKFMSEEVYLIFLEVDDKNKLWRSIHTWNFKVYNYSDILSVEIVLDKETETSSGLGGMMLGGALFGTAGAVLGALTEGSTTRCRALGIKITINDLNDPMVYIPFVDDQAGTLTDTTSSQEYKEKVALANECMALFNIIIEQNKLSREATPHLKAEQFSSSSTGNLSIPDEIMKYKDMLDKGIITQDEFEKAKNKLLN